MKAIYPGSFDPFTLGHLNILERAARLFDHIDVVVASNRSKNYMFSAEERYEIIRLSTDHLQQSLSVVQYPGIIADYIQENHIDAIIRGIRGSTDLDYEIKLEQYNRKACLAETVYLTPTTKHLNTSSTLVKMFLQSKKLDLAAEYLTDNAHAYIGSLLRAK
ncbi:pantetheine-phosphate adenylyltransferase [Paenibacillus doosanensis]|uniref:Phosphopantetheine adenylyltransferase n=1 Tax=Paenibacillus konkukensis TaxID=2020716 RepID=A0ABY4RYT9_9BACL|nr:MULTISPECIES: pantetheine-phosphate adenylyltransferase [Paenibacillus]MCS7458660.1 pantetheine-phosphate adenylyltransferase [Paenibacillus doosanensis]UQZ86816.1 Phosphopantetheine adenylyltransferase [Paenibacillus konkukensis]